MKKSYVKSSKEYDKEVELDSKKILEAMKRYKNAKKNLPVLLLIKQPLIPLKKLRKHRVSPIRF